MLLYENNEPLTRNLFFCLNSLFIQHYQVTIVEKADSSNVLPSPLSISTKNRMTFLFANLKDRDFLVQRISDFLQQTSSKIYFEREITSSFTSSDDEVSVELFFPSSVSVFYQSLQALCSIWYTSCWGFSLKTFPGDFKDITRSIATLTIMIHLLKVVFATATDFSLLTSIRVCLCVYRCTPSTAVFSPTVHSAAVWAQRARASASSTSTTTVFPRQHRPSWQCTVVARLRSSIPNW